MIDLSVNESGLASAVKQASERNFRIPTFAQMRDPNLIPDDVKAVAVSVMAHRIRLSGHFNGASTETAGSAIVELLNQVSVPV